MQLKKWGTNYVNDDRVLLAKYQKIQFDISYLVICLLCVDTTLVYPLGVFFHSQC